MPYLCSLVRATRDLQVFLGNKWAPGCNLKQAESANRKGTNRWKRNQNNNKNRCLLNLVQGHYCLKTSIVVFIKSWSSFILMLVGDCFMPNSFSVAWRSAWLCVNHLHLFLWDRIWITVVSLSQFHQTFAYWNLKSLSAQISDSREHSRSRTVHNYLCTAISGASALLVRLHPHRLPLNFSDEVQELKSSTRKS